MLGSHLETYMAILSQDRSISARAGYHFTPMYIQVIETGQIWDQSSAYGIDSSDSTMSDFRAIKNFDECAGRSTISLVQNGGSRLSRDFSCWLSQSADCGATGTDKSSMEEKLLPPFSCRFSTCSSLLSIHFCYYSKPRVRCQALGL